MFGGMGKLENIQVARFFAALMVVALHLTQYLERDFGFEGYIFHVGGAGVDVFFVISGFIITGISLNSTASVYEFFIKRVVRIIPLYYFCTGVVFVMAISAPHLLNTPEVGVLELIKSAFFIPYEKFNGTIHPVFYLGWTLNYEVFFYVMTTLCLCVTRKYSAELTIIVLVVFVVIGYVFSDSDNLLVRFYCDGIILDFVYGVLMYRVYRYLPDIFTRFSWLLGGGVFVLCMQVFVLLPYPRELSFGLPAALIVFGLIGARPGSGLLFRQLVRLGDASYSTYLLHPFLLQAGALLVVSSNSINMLTSTIFVVFVFSFLPIISLLSFKYLEQGTARPLKSWLDSLAGNRVKSAL